MTAGERFRPSSDETRNNTRHTPPLTRGFCYTSRMPDETAPKAPTRLDKAQALLLTHEEYVDHPFATSSGEDSFVVDVTGNGKHLLYFGSAHTNDPANPVFEEIATAYTTTNPQMVYVEGMEGIHEQVALVREKLSAMSLDDAKRRGEGFYTLKLAVDAGAQFESPEPPLSLEISHLRSAGYSTQDLFSYYAYRIISQYQREHIEQAPDTCEVYIAPHLDHFQEAAGISPEECAVLQEDLFRTLDLEHIDYHSLADPMPWKNKYRYPTNEVSAASSRFRDEYALKRIALGLQTHDRIFVTYGSGHAVTLSKALGALLSEE